MDLENHTEYPAAIFRSVVDDQRVAAAVVARVTFDITPDGARPSAEQPWIVSAAPWENEYGQMTADEVFIRGGTDVFLFGQAWASGRGVAEMEVVIEVGTKFRRCIAVVGHRSWVRRGKGLVPTAPRPFESIPLTLANAFGGKDRWDGLDVPYPDNAEGKGFVLEERTAEGVPLPNIEDPDHRIVRWNDRPAPIGLGMCPITCGLRLRNGIVLNDKSQIEELKPVFFNSAFPRMIADNAVVPGDVVRVTGVQPTGPHTFRIPELRLMTRLRFGNEVIERPLAIDQIGVESERSRFFVTYRYPFRYVLYPLQKRSCELLGPTHTYVERAS
jgi:hypothetical protein